jgi:hypothetical protein
MKLQKAITALVLAINLAGCGAADVILNGFFYSRTVTNDLENATDLRPQVAFEWRNGSFQSVTVTFPHPYLGKPLDELAGTVREIVVKDFKQTPDTIVLAFSLDK